MSSIPSCRLTTVLTVTTMAPIYAGWVAYYLLWPWAKLPETPTPLKSATVSRPAAFTIYVLPQIPQDFIPRAHTQQQTIAQTISNPPHTALPVPTPPRSTLDSATQRITSFISPISALSSQGSFSEKLATESKPCYKATFSNHTFMTSSKCNPLYQPTHCHSPHEAIYHNSCFEAGIPTPSSEVAASSKAPQTPTTPQMVLRAPVQGSATTAPAVMPPASPIASLTHSHVQPPIEPPADTPIATGPSSARALFQDQATLALEPAQVVSTIVAKEASAVNLPATVIDMPSTITTVPSPAALLPDAAHEAPGAALEPRSPAQEAVSVPSAAPELPSSTAMEPSTSPSEPIAAPQRLQKPAVVITCTKSMCQEPAAAPKSTKLVKLPRSAQKAALTKNTKKTTPAPCAASATKAATPLSAPALSKAAAQAAAIARLSKPKHTVSAEPPQRVEQRTRPVGKAPPLRRWRR